MYMLNIKLNIYIFNDLNTDIIKLYLIIIINVYLFFKL